MFILLNDAEKGKYPDLSVGMRSSIAKSFADAVMLHENFDWYSFEFGYNAEVGAHYFTVVAYSEHRKFVQSSI